MTLSRWCWCWKLGLVGLLGMSEALSFSGNHAKAQIVPDGILGTESSVVTPSVINGIPNDQIDGGAKRGVNLFHSFREFNIDEGRGAYFSNPVGIENILSRVTGGSRSNILGTLGVLGNANLFLINPNGIIFGPNASLDVGGSFVATTANAVQLGDAGGIFSASEPATSHLLTVNPSAFLFNAISSQEIVNRSTATSTVLGLAVNGLTTRPINGLQVLDSQSLLLVGGNVTLDGGILRAPGGQVELGGLAGSGTVGLSMDGNNLSLSFPHKVERANVLLTNSPTNASGIDVAAGGGGRIAVNAQNLNTSGGSVLNAGIGPRLGSVGTQAGDIKISAIDTLTVEGASSILNLVGDGASGNGGEIIIDAGSLNVTSLSQIVTGIRTGMGSAGNIVIETGELSIRNGARVVSSNLGSGQAGDIAVTASGSVEVIGASAADSRLRSALITGTTGVGGAGNLRIVTGQLSIRDGALVSAGTTTRSQGQGGSLAVTASESVEVVGTTADGQRSGLSTQIEGVGDAGDLTINTGRLLVRDGASVSASTLGQGSGGTLTVNASESIELIGRTPSGEFPSALITETLGTGNAGNMTIVTRKLSIQDGAAVSARAFSSGGQGGTLAVNASESVELFGRSADGQFGSGLLASTTGAGAAGDLSITTEKLIVRDGAAVSTGTAGIGPGGTLTVNSSNSVELTGRSPDGQYSSGLYTNTLGAGNARNLTIATGQLIVQDGAAVSAATSGQGSGGDISVQANSLSLTDAAFITSNSTGQGRAGKVTINVRDTLQANNSTISTATAQSVGGAIEISAGDIRLRGDSDITTSVFSGADNGGNIDLTADSIIAFDDSNIVAFARQGRGGNINLNTPAFFGFRYQPAPPDTDPTTLDGNNRVDINASGAVAGVIILPDVTFIQSSLTELPENVIDTNTLVANSCIARSNQQQGSFNITGAGGLPTRPGDTVVSPYPTGIVRSIPNSGTTGNPTRAVSDTGAIRPWKLGDPIIEPQGAYRLSDGQLVLSRECP